MYCYWDELGEDGSMWEEGRSKCEDEVEGDVVEQEDL